jgi:hypothetical protein
LLLFYLADNTAAHFCRDWKVTTMTKTQQQERQKMQSSRLRRAVGFTIREMTTMIANFRIPDDIVY